MKADAPATDVLQERLPAAHLARRLSLQRIQYLRHRHGWKHALDQRLLDVVVVALKLTGLHARCREHAIDYRVVTNEVSIARLPRGLDGLRILHLSDLHVESIVDGGARLAELLGSLEADLAVITGDFRFSKTGSHLATVRALAPLLESIERPLGTFAVLGNHDPIELVVALERLDVRFLVNEHVAIERGGERLWLAGVDDPYYFRTHDLDRALDGVPADAPRILLAHSAEAHAEAAGRDVDLYLCGHSHGGQLCLPGGRALVHNSRAPRELRAGPWRAGRTHGYTSRGTGTSGVALRAFCPPEVLVHRLKRSV